MSGAAGVGHATSAVPPAQRTEVAGLPVLTYDSDTGLLVAGALNVAHFEPNAAPYAYRIQLALSISFKATDSGLRAPLHDDEVAIDVPGLWGGRAAPERRRLFQALSGRQLVWSRGRHARGRNHPPVLQLHAPVPRRRGERSQTPHPHPRIADRRTSGRERRHAGAGWTPRPTD